jgi:hypothetical protein
MVNLAPFDCLRVSGQHDLLPVERAAHRRRPRALDLSSPIGLGHIGRDLAIADESAAIDYTCTRTPS